MIDTAPGPRQAAELLGGHLYTVWTKLCAMIDAAYDMEHLWADGGKAWACAYKYRRGGRTLCALYARKGCMGFLVILGRAEREAFERAEWSPEVWRIYRESPTYHDGKWLMFTPADAALFDDFRRLLALKRRPNR